MRREGPLRVALAVLLVAGVGLRLLVHAAPPNRPGAPGAPPRCAAEAVTVADGLLPSGTTPWDDLPGVRDLDPDLLAALRAAALQAAGEGVAVYVTSGWRSPEHQARLLCEAVAPYGSEAAAARGVEPVDSSLHVSGDAVDVGPASAADWLARHGAAFGLCRVYANEPWHFELRQNAAEERCPPLYRDAASDPRL